MELQEKIQAFTDQLATSQRIVFFGGAGVSTESGIPDFRSADGIFMQETGHQYSPEQVISKTFFDRYPQAFYDFYFDKLVYPQAKPNLAHSFWVDLEKKGKQVTIVTQNIDGLHQQAGSSRVYELHGSVWRNYCLDCGATYTADQLQDQRDGQGIPRCTVCGGQVRPDVVLYEEGLDQAVIQGAVQAIQEADLLVIAGTSLVVYPAAGLIQYYQGDKLTVINKTPLRLTNSQALHFEAAIAPVLDQVDLAKIS